MGLITSTFGNKPNPNTYEYFAWMDQVLAWAQARNPIARTTTRYIRQSGSGSALGGGGNGLTTSTPWLVRDCTDLATLISNNQWSGDIAFLLRCGDIYYSNSTVPSTTACTFTQPNCTLATWVDSGEANLRLRLRPPEITAFSAAVTSGWTQASAGSPWYYRDYLANGTNRPRGVRFSDADPNRSPLADIFRFHDKSTGGPFTSAADAELTTLLADSTAENVYTLLWVSATTYRIYVKLATGDPNTNTHLEILHGTGPGVTNGIQDGCRFHGCVTTGWGRISDSGGVGTQVPGILLQNTGNTLGVVTSWASFVSGTHIAEHYSAGNGGSAIFIDTVGGYAAGDRSTTAVPFVGFSPATGTPGDGSGGNEIIYARCRISHGCLPVYSFSTAAGGPNFWVGWFGHTGNNANPCELIIAHDCSIDPNLQGVGYFQAASGDVGAPSNELDPATYKGAITNLQVGGNPNCLWAYPPRFAIVNATYNLVRWGTAPGTGAINYNTAGSNHVCFCSNVEVFVDARDLSPASSNTFPYWVTAAPSGTYLRPHSTNTRFYFLFKEKNVAPEFVNRSLTSTTTGHGSTYNINCEFYSLYTAEQNVTGLPNLHGCTMGFPNQQATASQGGYASCAFINFQRSNAAAGFNGYDNSNSYDATNVPGFINAPPQGMAHPLLTNRGSQHPYPAMMPQFDRNGVPRDPGNPQIGPVLPTSAIYKAPLRPMYGTRR